MQFNFSYWQPEFPVHTMTGSPGSLCLKLPLRFTSLFIVLVKICLQVTLSFSPLPQELLERRNRAPPWVPEAFSHQQILLGLPAEKAGGRFPRAPCSRGEDGAPQPQPRLFHPVSLPHLAVGCCRLARHLVFRSIHGAFPVLSAAPRHCPGKQPGKRAGWTRGRNCLC